MARIPEEEVGRLKREVSVERLAEARGVKLRRSGKELLGLCPFRNDTNPSLRINPAQNIWRCCGACDRGGSVIDWVMHAEGVSFRHRLRRATLARTMTSRRPSCWPRWTRKKRTGPCAILV